MRYRTEYDIAIFICHKFVIRIVVSWSTRVHGGVFLNVKLYGESENERGRTLCLRYWPWCAVVWRQPLCWAMKECTTLCWSRDDHSFQLPDLLGIKVVLNCAPIDFVPSRLIWLRSGFSWRSVADSDLSYLRSRTRLGLLATLSGFPCLQVRAVLMLKENIEGGMPDTGFANYGTLPTIFWSASYKLHL
jgi:hypothetical protein